MQEVSSKAILEIEARSSWKLIVPLNDQPPMPADHSMVNGK